jgi:dual specificity tyrosine-phosphorylation-regulated kinase 2/3/4
MSKIAEEYYDDEEGNYKGIRGDHIFYRYEVLSLLGNGSFGNVLRCFDHKLQKECALKMLRCFKDDKNQVDLEIEILMEIREKKLNQYIIEIMDQFEFRGHKCMTTEVLSLNLYDLIKESNFNGLNMDVIRKIAIQCLNALRTLKQN